MLPLVESCMHIKLLKPSDVPRDLWNAIEALYVATHPRLDPMMGTQFARLASDVRPDARLVVAEAAGAPVAAWPLLARPGGWARPIGGPFSDWHGPAIAPGAGITAPQLLDGADIGGMTVFGYAPVPGEPLVAGERVGANLTHIDSDYPTWMESQRAMHPKHFKKMRRMSRNLSRDFSEVVMEVDDTSDAAFDTIIALKRDQFARTGRHDVLATPWAQRFLDALRHHDTPGLHMRTATLHADGQFAAGEIALCSETVVHGWLTAFSPDFAGYSPGYLVVEAILESMPERGQTLYDAGCDLDYYKKYYANLMAPLDRGVLRAGTAKLSPARLLGAGWRTLEDSLPGKAGDLLGKVRRRSDQILTSEITLPARARGFVQAISR